MKNSGFSLVEFMVAMTVMLFLLMMTTYTFQRITHRVKDGESAIETRGNNLGSIELLRLDLEHAGFGIANIKSDGNANNIQPVFWDTTNADTLKHTLNIASTLKNTEPDTLGWATATYNGTNFTIDVENREKASQSTLWIDIDGRFTQSGTANPPQTDNIYIGYPYDYTVAGASQPYSPVQYRMSSSQTLEACSNQTRNIIRAVDASVSIGGVGGAGGDPAFNCVAGFVTQFAWDENEDGDIEDTITGGFVERHYTGTLPSGDGSTDEIRRKLKYTSVYILIQQGKRDRTYTFQGFEDTTLTGNTITFSADGRDITFTTPFDFDDDDELDDFLQHRWKVLKVAAPLQGR